MHGGMHLCAESLLLARRDAPLRRVSSLSTEGCTSAQSTPLIARRDAPLRRVLPPYARRDAPLRRVLPSLLPVSLLVDTFPSLLPVSLLVDTSTCRSYHLFHCWLTPWHAHPTTRFTVGRHLGTRRSRTDLLPVSLLVDAESRDGPAGYPAVYRPAIIACRPASLPYSPVGPPWVHSVHVHGWTISPLHSSSGPTDGFSPTPLSAALLKKKCCTAS